MQDAYFYIDENGNEFIEKLHFGIYCVFNRKTNQCIGKTNDVIDFLFEECQFHRLDGPAIIENNEYDWMIHDIDITNEINDWMQSNNISYPFNIEAQTLFTLTYL